MRLYHFTSKRHLALIIRDQYLKKTDSNLQEPDALEILRSTVDGYSFSTVGPDNRPTFQPPSDNRVVWLTRNGRQTKQPWAKLPAWAAQKTDIRITVEIPVDDAHRWIDWAKRNGMAPWWRKALAATDRNFRAWYVVERDIYSDEWTAIEEWQDGRWVSIAAPRTRLVS